MTSVKILNAMPPYTLFGVENDYKNAKVVVLPIPYDSTTTYKSGARDGPHAIIDASRNMEFYSEELDGDVTELGICTLDELFPSVNSPEETVNMIEKEVSQILDDGKIPLCIGGDHTIAVGPIRAVAKRNKDFSVIHFDAHSDARDTYAGSKYCHACIMARAREVCGSCISVGVRSIDADSAKKVGKEIIYRKDMHDMTLKQVIDDIVKRTREKVYITIDVDVLDPSEMPSTGTPEPDGLRYYELTSILKGILSKKKLLGLDFTELSPPVGNNLTAPNFLVAKLIYTVLGYAYYNK